MKKLLLITALFGLAQIKAQSFQWAAAQGGTNIDYCNSVATDAAGNVYITGNYMGTIDLDPGPGTFTFTNAGFDDAYITKLDASGNFVWAKHLGGTGYDQGRGITVDASGNILCTGYFNGPIDFDPGPGTFTVSSGGTSAAFVWKLDANGNFIWAKSLIAQFTCMGSSIVTDASGNVFTTGAWRGTSVDFDPGPSTYSLSTGGLEDIFVSKLDAAGNFVWAKSMGGSGSDNANAIALDPSGNVFTTGYYLGTCDFDPGAATFTIASAGGSDDIFISKLDASGNFVWAKSMGGSSNSDYGNGIGADASGNVYTTGQFRGTADLDPGAGTFNVTSFGTYDVFVSKLDASGNFVWTKQLGGTGSDNALGLALDASGNVYTIGTFNSTADFDPGTGSSNLSAIGTFYFDIFVSKLNSAGNFVYALQMGGPSNDHGAAISTDATGNLYCAGHFTATADFDPSSTSTVNLTSSGNQDGWVVKLSAGSAGVHEGNNIENTISIYPNPSSGLFTIRSKNNSNTTIEIINVLGEVVYTEVISSFTKQIDLQHLSNGIYSARSSEGTKTSSTKLIIQK